ncbi:hypothetical protein HJG60_010022 [Phyllostomus discolor]|uniref:Uncharacterized protein n=1 Tax=Phyllostomus discolor TaxID=89673 RepID=A0A834EG01_9CHIR|nr:hypothetical protein HJG60_010022 [Phyllostomus discolor]
MIQTLPLTVAKARGPVLHSWPDPTWVLLPSLALRTGVLPVSPGTLAPPGTSWLFECGQQGWGGGGSAREVSPRPRGAAPTPGCFWGKPSLSSRPGFGGPFRGGGGGRSPWRAVPCPGHCGDSPQAPFLPEREPVPACSLSPAAAPVHPARKHRPAGALLLPLESSLGAVPGALGVSDWGSSPLYSKLHLRERPPYLASFADCDFSLADAGHRAGVLPGVRGSSSGCPVAAEAKALGHAAVAASLEPVL